MSDTELARAGGEAIAALLNNGLAGMNPLDNSALGHALRRAVDADFSDQGASHGSRM